MALPPVKNDRSNFQLDHVNIKQSRTAKNAFSYSTPTKFINKPRILWAGTKTKPNTSPYKPANYTNVLSQLKLLPSKPTRLKIVVMVGWLSSDCKRAIPALIKCLSHKDTTVVRKAAMFLAFLGPMAKSAEGALLKAAFSLSLRTQHMALLALSSIGPVSVKTKRRLYSKLTGRNWAIRKLALRVLVNTGNIEAGAEKAIISIAKTMIASTKRASKPNKVHIEMLALAVKALGKMTKPSRRSEIIIAMALANRNKGVRSEAATALGDRGKVFNSKTVKVLEFLLAKDLISVKINVAFALGKLDRVSASGVKLLKPLLKHPVVEMRSAAAFAIGTGRKKALTAVPDLLKLLNDPSREVQMNALGAIATIKPRTTNTVRALIKLTKNQLWLLRINAVHALYKLGKIAKPLAIPRIKAMMREKRNARYVGDLKRALAAFSKL